MFRVNYSSLRNYKTRWPCEVHVCFFPSFVVGSDGYVYEGRGWHHRGAHTRDRNSLGYGVAVIGDYTSALPPRSSMELLRRRLVRCAVGGGRLAVNYTLLGHRQVGNHTSCPGDAFYSEISTWEHFGKWSKAKPFNIMSRYLTIENHVGIVWLNVFSEVSKWLSFIFMVRDYVS